MPVVTWDASFESAPADTDGVKYGAGKIRELKAALSERLEIEHDFKATGKHRPGKVACLYTGTTAEITALTDMSNGAIAYDETLDKLKLYDSGAWVSLSLGSFPAGTKMLFYQDAAPTGWTIQNTLDDKLVFVTKGSVAGGETGGAVHSTGSWTLTTGSHALTIAELASHNHSHSHTITTWVDPLNSATVGMGGTGGPYSPGASTSVDATNTGSGSGHTHTSSAWRPAAYNCIIARKD